MRVLTQTLMYGDSESVKSTAAHAQANKLGVDSTFHSCKGAMKQNSGSHNKQGNILQVATR